MIAARAGVSSATVSLALRNHPRISVDTVQRVKRVAASLGYRPDPEVAKLMHHLRTRRTPGFQSTICALTTIAPGKETLYVKSLLDAARSRAESLGYQFDLVQLENRDVPRPDLQRMLRSRGVEGLLLAPMSTPRSFARLLDWKQFSVVASTYGVLAPEFHRVVPHQFASMLLICEQLAGRGYRRIGLVMPVEHDLRVRHCFSAAAVWQGALGGTEFVRPLIHPGVLPERVREWFERERPDVIVAAGAADCYAIAKQIGVTIPGPVAFALTDCAEAPLFSGIDERPSEIGLAAIELLNAKIQTGEKGIPVVPVVTMIEGAWVEGKSVKRSQRGADGPTRRRPRTRSHK